MTEIDDLFRPLVDGAREGPPIDELARRVSRRRRRRNIGLVGLVLIACGGTSYGLIAASHGQAKGHVVTVAGQGPGSRITPSNSEQACALLPPVPAVSKVIPQLRIEAKSNCEVGPGPASAGLMVRRLWTNPSLIPNHPIPTGAVLYVDARLTIMPSNGPSTPMSHPDTSNPVPYHPGAVCGGCSDSLSFPGNVPQSFQATKRGSAEFEADFSDGRMHFTLTLVGGDPSRSIAENEFVDIVRAWLQQLHLA